MTWIRWAAKAITAAAAAFATAVATYNLDVHPAVLVAVATLVAGVGVFLVPNGSPDS